jgi:hypothetical protein
MPLSAAETFSPPSQNVRGKCESYSETKTTRTTTTSPKAEVFLEEPLCFLGTCSAFGVKQTPWLGAEPPITARLLALLPKLVIPLSQSLL